MTPRRRKTATNNHVLRKEKLELIMTHGMIKEKCSRAKHAGKLMNKQTVKTQRDDHKAVMDQVMCRGYGCKC